MKSVVSLGNNFQVSLVSQDTSVLMSWNIVMMLEEAHTERSFFRGRE